MISRFFTFLLVPFYTNIFVPEDYGIITNVYAFIALFSIIFLYGMDAAFLKYDSEASDEKFNDRFSTPYLSVLTVSFLLSLLISMLKEPVSQFLAVPEKFYYLIYFVASILFFDAISSLPFIKLRIERKAKIRFV
jgi:O-antigen/teichoic acid export membrane protein